MDNSLISVIIPLYNHASVLKRSLLSLVQQTYQPLEVIIVNDGSTDNFSELKLGNGEWGMGNKKNNIFIRVINQENQGAPVARNRGFKESRGKYVIFWDADTIAKPDMIEKMYNTLKNNLSASYVYSQFKFGWKTIKSHSFDSELLKKINYIDTTSLIRRKDFTYFDESLKKFQDWDLWLTMLENNKTGVFIPEILFKKLIGNRIGISKWLPSFMYKLLPNSKSVKKYSEAKKIIINKHKILL